MLLMKKSLSRPLLIAAVALLAGMLAAFLFAFLRPALDVPVPAPEVPDGTGAAAQPGTAFLSSRYGFSVRYRDGYVPDESYAYATLGPDRQIPGVAFRVPEALSTGTNLSADSTLSVEVVEDRATCDASAFLDPSAPPTTVQEGGRSWSVGRFAGAGAGNRYEETVYATAVGGDCFGLRLLVHSTVLENYEPGTVQAFDAARLEADYAAFRSSFEPAG